ncbi:MAG: response regulator [Spirochaetota bacterium]|nr:response regulator [Spirochaetota bacterium]
MNEDANNDRILIVDDMKSNIDILSHLLKNDYIIDSAIDGLMALAKVKENHPDLILLDVMMPGLDGYQVCERLKGDEETNDIPVIFITGMDEFGDKSKAFEIGAVDYINKPFDIFEVKARIKTHLALKHATDELQKQDQIFGTDAKESIEGNHENQFHIFHSFGRAAEYWDNKNSNHIIRISNYSYLLARAYGMSDEDCELLRQVSVMHDVGKIAIPESILLKPDKLDDDEWEIMKTHTAIGEEMLSVYNSKHLSIAQQIAATHHEKWDGSGYPRGLQKEEIPIEGRIVALCDVFDALTSDRPFREAWSVEDAVTEIKKRSGTHFDPNLVKVFMEILDDIILIKKKYPD